MTTPPPAAALWSAPRSPRQLGTFVRRVRTERGLTQAELADELGVTRQYVVELESGAPTLYATRLFDALRTLGITLRLEAETEAETGPEPGARP